MDSIKNLKKQILMSLVRGEPNMISVSSRLIEAADEIDNNERLGNEIRILTDELRLIIR